MAAPMKDTSAGSGILLSGMKNEKEGNFLEAVRLYTKVLHLHLFDGMMNVTDFNVKKIQEARFRCFRALRG